MVQPLRAHKQWNNHTKYCTANMIDMDDALTISMKLAQAGGIQKDWNIPWKTIMQHQ